MPTDIQQIAPGLWRWTAPHPDWRPSAPRSPSYWEQTVGSVLYADGEQAVFIDPLLPPDPGPFWAWADERVDKRSTYVLTTLKWHRRSRDAFVERYGASTSRAKRNLPNSVDSFVVPGGGETMFWLSEPKALVPGDRILGDDAAGGDLRLCPDSWMRYLASDITAAQLRTKLNPLQNLPVEHVLVSHGEPVIGNGARALRRLLAPPAGSRSRA